MSKPKITIFMWQNASYIKQFEFDMELAKNIAGVPNDPMKYILQAISMNHLKTPVMLNAVHLTQEGVEIYVSNPSQ